MSKSKKTLLITGAAGGMAQLMADRLSEESELIGVDPRPMKSSFPGKFYQTYYDQRKMRDVVRLSQIDVMLHLGRIRVTSNASSQTRFRINVLGTKNLLELSKRYGIKHNIIVSTFHVYGANPGNPSYLSEEDPLRASQSFHELADVVEMDHVSSTFLWQNPNIPTTILRPVNIIGPTLKNATSNIFRSQMAPRFLGFDPLLQFIHEQDFINVIQLCLKKPTSGIFNVTGEGALPYSKALELSGTSAIPIPSAAFFKLIKPFFYKQRGSVPKHLLDYFKYQTLVSDNRFRETFSYQPKVTTAHALSELKDSKVV